VCQIGLQWVSQNGIFSSFFIFSVVSFSGLMFYQLFYVLWGVFLNLFWYIPSKLKRLWQLTDCALTIMKCNGKFWRMKSVQNLKMYQHLCRSCYWLVNNQEIWLSLLLMAGMHKRRCHVTIVTKFFTLALNSCGPLVWNLSPFWYMEFWDGFHVFGKFVHPWLMV